MVFQNATDKLIRRQEVMCERRLKVSNYFSVDMCTSMAGCHIVAHCLEINKLDWDSFCYPANCINIRALSEVFS